MGQLALAWLLEKEEHTLIPIPGTKHQEYMIENAGASTVQVTPEVCKVIEGLFNESKIMGDRYSAGAMAAADAERD